MSLNSSCSFYFYCLFCFFYSFGFLYFSFFLFPVFFISCSIVGSCINNCNGHVARSVVICASFLVLYAARGRGEVKRELRRGWRNVKRGGKGDVFANSGFFLEKTSFCGSV